MKSENFLIGNILYAHKDHNEEEQSRLFNLNDKSHIFHLYSKRNPGITENFIYIIHVQEYWNTAQFYINNIIN